MRAVTNALRVFERVAEQQPIGVSELARQLELPKSTVQRALLALHDLGWIAQETGEPRRWVQTTKLLALASRGGGLSLRERAMPVMQALRERTDENVHLSVRSGNGVVIIEKLESSSVVRLYDPLGVVAPVHASSTGKAILAWSDPAEVEEVLAQPLEGFTQRTVVDPDELRKELRSIRRHGYAVNRGEWREDVRGVAVPILDARGLAIGAISLAVPAHRLPDRRIPEVAEVVVELVSSINDVPHATDAASDRA